MRGKVWQKRADLGDDRVDDVEDQERLVETGAVCDGRPHRRLPIEDLAVDERVQVLLGVARGDVVGGSLAHELRQVLDKLDLLELLLCQRSSIRIRLLLLRLS